MRWPVLADAAADVWGWAVLGRYFDRGPYSDLRADPARRLAARGLEVEPEAMTESERIHERIGWRVFLQELWGEPALDEDSLYGDAAPLPASGRLAWALALLRRPAAIRLELSGALGQLEGPCDAAVTVGGAPLLALSLERGERLPVDRIRAAVTTAAGAELLRLAVREGLLGRPAGEPGSLRERLARTAAAEPEATGNSRVEARGTVRPLPGWEPALRSLLPDGGVALARRRGPVGTSVSRRATFPADAASTVVDAARAAGEPLVRTGSNGQVAYAPELLWLGDRLVRPAPVARSRRSPRPPSASRHDFERTFAGRPDPWNYESDYERQKYRQTLDLIPGRPGNALEVGCAEGHFTVLAAERVERLVAADISQIALDRAAERCAAAPNVELRRLDLLHDELPGGFDLVVCSEMLYYMGDRDGLAAAARKLAGALAPGGHLLTAHPLLLADDPSSAGFDWDLPFGGQVIGEALAADGGLHLLRELRTPLYVVQLYGQRAPASGSPELTRVEQPTEPPPRAADSVRWHGGHPRSEPHEDWVTERLPILAYHRIASDGPEAADQWRVHPDDFAAQIAYLRDTGFHSVGLDEWREAAHARDPLAGRGVVITFDDGYADFAELAWPVLREHGFDATVFLVTERVGGTNEWDRQFGIDVPLLGWNEVARLRDEGVSFGSHSARHPRLTRLSPAEVVREAAVSRAELTRRLGVPPAAFAYPYGEYSPGVAHLIGACGYLYGLTCRPEPAGLEDALLMLPRVEIDGDDGLTGFIAKLAPPAG